MKKIILLCLILITIVGCRGWRSERPPVHLNPNINKPARKLLSKIKNIHLIEPLDYLSFIKLMDLSYIILTDSGGIQEEGPTLGKPILLIRDITERPEAVDLGTVKLVKVDRSKIIYEVNKLLNSSTNYNNMKKTKNPYGDGKASLRISKILRKSFIKDV